MNTKKLDAIRDALGKRNINVVIGDQFQQMSKFRSWYRGNVNDFHFYQIQGLNGIKVRKERKSLQMAKKVCEDWAGLLYNENVVLGLGKKRQNDRLQEILSENNFQDQIVELIEKSFALGDGFIVEYIEDGKVTLDYIAGDLVIHTHYKNGKVNGIVTVNEFVQGDTNYIHLTHHVVANDKYTIEHELYVYEQDGLRHSNNLSVIFDNASIKEMKREDANGNEVYVIEYDTAIKAFQQIKPNIVNNFDTESPRGLSIFANSIDALKSIDIQYDGFTNEFDLGRKRIFVKDEATKTQRVVDNVGQDDASVSFIKYFDTNETVFQSVPMGEDEDSIKTWDPELRVNEYTKGINQNLSMLAFKTGLGKKYYTFDANGTMTATGVISDNSDTFKAKRKHERLLAKAFKEMIEAIMYLDAKINNEKIDLDKLEYVISFDDSVIEDDGTKKREARDEIAMGIRSRISYIMEYRKMSEEEAREELARIESESEEYPIATSSKNNNVENVKKEKIGLTDVDQKVENTGESKA